MSSDTVRARSKNVEVIRDDYDKIKYNTEIYVFVKFRVARGVFS